MPKSDSQNKRYMHYKGKWSQEEQLKKLRQAKPCVWGFSKEEDCKYLRINFANHQKRECFYYHLSGKGGCFLWKCVLNVKGNGLERKINYMEIAMSV